jgi:hypothetical protein
MIMSAETLQTLIEAIAKQEGYGVEGARPTRNNNPGDLKPPMGLSTYWDGQTGTDPEGFAVFATSEWGWQALRTDLSTHAFKNPEQSLAGFIAVFAPSSENNTRAYTEAVASALNVNPVTTLLSDLV